MAPDHPEAPVAATPDLEPASGVAEPTGWDIETLPPELEYFRRSEAYQVELSGFQGPMDLLLYLIQKDELDIHDTKSIRELRSESRTKPAQSVRLTGSVGLPQER